MMTGNELANAIIANQDIMCGIAHSKLDCQAAVEKALKLIDVSVNYRGSNHMWREMVHDRETIAEYRAAHGVLSPGLICFHLKFDGSEKKRGYNDDMGAAVHVGVILDDSRVYHSGANGSEIRSLQGSTFNRVAKCNFLEYDTDVETDDEEIASTLNEISELRSDIQGLIIRVDNLLTNGIISSETFHNKANEILAILNELRGGSKS